MGVLGVSAGLLLCVPALPVVAGGRVASHPFFVLTVTVRAAVVVPAALAAAGPA